MAEPLRVLHLEDDPSDAELIKTILASEGVECVEERVETREGFLGALERGGYDIIFADYSLPSFDGISALKLAGQRRPELPFIFISGAIGEELAIETLKGGATDYVLKQRLSRLAPSVRRAIAEAKEKVERKLAEESLTYRLAIEDLVTSISTEFINIDPEEVDRGIGRALGKVCGFAGADRCCLLQFSYDGARMDVTHEWCARGVQPFVEKLRGLASADYPWSMERLRRFEHVLVEDVAALPPEAEAERRALEAGSIRSGAMVPLVYSNSLKGLLGLGSEKAARKWRGDDAAMFKMVGEIFVNTIERKKTEMRIKNQLEQMRALRTIDMAITASLDLRVTLDVFIEQVVARLHMDAADVLLLNPRTFMLEFAAGRGFLTDSVRKVSIRLGQEYAGEIAFEGRLRMVPDVGHDEAAIASAEVVRKEGFKAYFGVPLIVKGQVKGVLEIYHRAPFHPDGEWLNFLEALAGQAAIAIDNASLFNDLQRSNNELVMAYDATIQGWSHALDYRDRETEGHSERVTHMTVKMAAAMGIRDEQLVHVRRGALLHDIGKLGVPDRILFKPGRLSPEEWELMKRHPLIAHELLSPIAFLRPALEIPYGHHERWDGTGYPRGLRDDQIPLPARIFTVVDVWDALRSDRAYRPAWPAQKARDYIHSLSGDAFDPGVVEAFLDMKW